MPDDEAGFKKLIVYYDDKYPTIWIKREVSRKITEFLKSKGFVKYDAQQLAKWMEESIQDEVCWQSVVVFSQDVIPDTICHAPEPSALIREYLDKGGRVVWLGDIPFFYLGLSSSRLDSKFGDLRIAPLISYRDDVFEGVHFTKVRSQLFQDREGNICVRWGSGACFSILGVMPLYLDFPSSKVSITKSGKV